MAARVTDDGSVDSAAPVAADVLTEARRIADEVLFPAAMETDRADAVPASHFDALAAAGLYGIFGPAEAGGLGLDRPAGCAVVEELAGGCLATTFILIQHFGLLRALSADDAPARLRDAWLGPACRGELRAGIALAGLLPGPPMLRARAVSDGWVLAGTCPWVTGWGRVTALLVAARGPGDTIVTLVLDAANQVGLTVTRQQLTAVNASATVQLDFADVLVPADRLVSRVPFDPAMNLTAAALRVNGSLALGLAGRCCRLLGASPLDDELDTCRQRLDAAGDQTIQSARAAASELAVRAAAALAVHDGSRSITAVAHAQRLTREATFLLVFGSRPGIRAELLRRLGASAG
jgi:alkylation response protein AidB-like acyl-CoA dehydrogenase